MYNFAKMLLITKYVVNRRHLCICSSFCLNAETTEDSPSETENVHFDFLLDGEFLQTALSEHLKNKELSSVSVRQCVCVCACACMCMCVCVCVCKTVFVCGLHACMQACVLYFLKFL